jgi:23S rRNA G2445 N2-methylase RlmL
VIIDQLRIVGSPQTNKVMAGELSRLAVRALGRRPPEPRKAGTGQLIYPFDAGLAAVAATYARTPTRAVWDLYRSEAERLEPLYDDLVRDVAGDARRWLPAKATISVEVRRMGDFPAGERQVVGTVKNAIVDGAAERGIEVRVDPERPDVLVVARLDEDGSVVVSADVAGGSMTQRGWRASHGIAPLREHLAAVLVMLGRFDPRVDVLVDPMCGAGTIGIEALLMARGAARQLERPNIPALDEAWPKGEPLFGDSSPVIIGNDVDVGVLVGAKHNASDAGVAGEIVWRRGHFGSLSPREIAEICAERGKNAERGLILCNPPYGERLDPIDLRLIYGELGDYCQQFRGWRAGFLVGNLDFEQAFGRPANIKKPLSNAGIRSYFYGYDLG